MLSNVVFALALIASEQSTVVYTRRSAEEVYLWGQGLPDGKHFEYSVSKKVFAKVPPWHPDRDPPPLSISRAFAIAKKMLRTDQPNWPERDIVLSEIQLYPASSFDFPDRWFYVFQFYLKGESLPAADATVVVLMDQTVVKPKAVEAPYR